MCFEFEGFCQLNYKESCVFKISFTINSYSYLIIKYSSVFRIC